MLHYQIQSIGLNRGVPRVWLQDLVLTRAGFDVGDQFSISIEESCVQLVRSVDGERTVSAKPQRDRVVPAVDLNSHKVLGVFAGLTTVRVIVPKQGTLVISAVTSELRLRERRTRVHSKLNSAMPLDMGSVSHGGGVMCHAIHQGLTEAGIDGRLVFANEIRVELLEQASRHNTAWEPDTVAIAAPLQAFVFDDDLPELPRIDVLEGGLPCSGASISGRSKRGLSLAEAHPEVGHLMVAFLTLIARTNPIMVVLENVRQYLSTGSAWQFRHQLGEWGYDIHEVIIRGGEFGALEDRERAVLLAVTEGITLDPESLDKPSFVTPRLGGIIDPVPDDSPQWSTMAGLRDKETRDAEAGKGFKMQIYDETATSIATIGKGYAKRRSTEPKIRHPHNPSLLRQLTPAEHARAKRIPEALISGLSDTIAHEVLGQSVIHSAFVSIGKLIGDSLLRWGSQRTA